MAENFFEMLEVQACQLIEKTDNGREIKHWREKENRCYRQLNSYLTKKQARQLFCFRDCIYAQLGLTESAAFRMGFYVALSLMDEMSTVARETK